MQKPHISLSLLAAAMLLAAFGGVAYAETPAATAGPAVRDGSHDFDFEMGKWKMHNRRLAKKFVGSHDWVEFESHSEAHPMPGVIGNEDVYRTDYFAKGFVGLTFRLYNPKTGLWRIYWVDSLSQPGEMGTSVVGKFTGNVGVFEGPDTYDGKPILVRYTWTVNPKGSPVTAHFEQAFSADAGKTWEPNFTNDLMPDDR